MKIDITRSSLYDAVNTLKDIAGSEGIVRNIHFRRAEAGSDRLTLTATDVNRTMVIDIEHVKFSAESPIEFVIPAKFLAQVLGVLHDGIVQIDTDFDINRIRLNCGDSTFKIPTENASTYPKLEVGGCVEMRMSQAALKTMCKSVSYAMANPTATRRQLIGLNLQFGESSIKTQATDGYRVAITEYCPDGMHNAAQRSVIIPDTSVKFLQRFLGDNGEIAVRIGKDQCGFVYSGADARWSFYTCLVADNYPNIGAFIPKDFKASVKVDRQQMLDAIKQASVSTSPVNYRVVMDISEGSIVLTAAGNEESDSRACVAVKYDGDPIHICLNPDYLTDMLSSVSHDEVELSISTRNLVCMQMKGLFALLMPMNI